MRVDRTERAEQKRNRGQEAKPAFSAARRHGQALWTSDQAMAISRVHRAQLPQQRLDYLRFANPILARMNHSDSRCPKLQELDRHATTGFATQMPQSRSATQ